MGLWRKRQREEPRGRSAAAPDPEDVAEGVVGHFALGFQPSPDPAVGQAVSEVLARCPGRSEAMVAAADLVAGRDSPRARRLAAEALTTAGAAYRPVAIEALTRYLDGPADATVYLGSSRTVAGVQTTPEQEAAIHLSAMWKALGEAYEGEYAFTEAESAYLQAWQLTPYFPHVWVAVAQVLIKQGRMEEAVALLEQAESSPYFTVTTWTSSGHEFTDDLFVQVITGYLAETREKQARGYVYRPRKKKSS